MKLICKCGETIFDQSDSLPNKAYVRRDQDADANAENLAQRLKEALKLKPNVPFDEYNLSNARYESDMYECMSCGCLLIFDQSNMGCPILYTPESGKYEGILKGSENRN